MIVIVRNESLHVTYDNVADLYYYSNIKKLNGYDKESMLIFSYDNIEPDDYTVYTDHLKLIENYFYQIMNVIKGIRNLKKRMRKMEDRLVNSIQLNDDKIDHLTKERIIDNMNTAKNLEDIKLVCCYLDTRIDKLKDKVDIMANQIRQCNANYDHIYNCLCSEITKREEQRPISKEKMEEIINELGTSQIDI